jgi:diketogulonate reductase-like aldo/keto reductase
MSNYGEKESKKSIEESLKKLQIDYADLVLLHWPGINF